MIDTTKLLARAAYLRKKFERHSETTQRIVASMTDEQLLRAETEHLCSLAERDERRDAGGKNAS